MRIVAETRHIRNIAHNKFLALILIVPLFTIVETELFLLLACGNKTRLVLAVALVLALEPCLGLPELGNNVFIFGCVTDVDPYHYKLIFGP